jgi:hypothetical protein
MLDQLLGPSLVQTFTQSDQGKQAMQVLASRLSTDQITKVISEGLPAAAGALKGQAKGPPGQAELGLFDVLGGHPGQAFLIGTMTSLAKGEGLIDAMQDGAFSIVGSHVTEVIASRVGLDRQTAGWVGAALTPFVVSFVQEKLGMSDAVTAKHGAPPSPADIRKIIEGKRTQALANPNDPTSKAILAEQQAMVQRALAAKAAAGAPAPKAAAVQQAKSAALPAAKPGPEAQQPKAPATPPKKK